MLAVNRGIGNRRRAENAAQVLSRCSLYEWSTKKQNNTTAGTTSPPDPPPPARSIPLFSIGYDIPQQSRRWVARRTRSLAGLTLHHHHLRRVGDDNPEHRQSPPEGVGVADADADAPLLRPVHSPKPGLLLPEGISRVQAKQQRHL